MKIRNGFVSNSSSSSFIVAIPKKVKTVEQLKEIMFPGQKFISHPYEDGVSITTKKIAETVFKDMEEQIPNNRESLLSEYDYNDRTESFAVAHSKDNIYVFSYSDNDGSFQSFMEHGGIFENLPHITISHH